MKFSKLIFLIFLVAFTFINAASQNALINVLTQNSGVTKKGKIVFLEITVNNTDPGSSIVAYKLRPQISVPSAIASIQTTGHVLPDGWTITSNNGSTLFLSNGSDIIAPNTARTILIAIQGNKIGGPSTISGQLSFSNGAAPGSAPGSLPGDNPADNSSTSTIKVIR
jgi:hypothetical protein